MKRVLTAVILIPIVIVVLFRAPLWLFALLVLGVALLAAREYFGIAEKTVKMHRVLMLERLGGVTTAEAIRIAVEAGM